MSGSKSKNKGKSFERDVCNILGKVYDNSFERVPYSGAFVGGVNASRKANLTENQIKAFKGDIIPPDNWMYFNCECKSYAEFPFHQLLQDKPIPLLEQWLEQTLDAHDDNDLDLLFMKFNRKGIYFAFPANLVDKCSIERYITYTSNNYGKWIITFWQDFQAHTANTILIQDLAINGVTAR